MYLLIANKGILEMPLFYLMGASTKSGVDTIGMFGTGAKYAIAALLRTGHQVTVYLGDKKIEFATRKVNVRDTSFSQIVIKQGKRTKETALTAELGKRDWGVEQALRELIANAIDEGEWYFQFTETQEWAPGETRFFISASPQVEQFVREFDKYFCIRRTPLYRDDSGGYALYDKVGPGTRVYRKGVLVYSHERDSAFDYELNSVNVNEERKSTSWDCEYELSSAVDTFPDWAKARVLEKVAASHNSFEGSLRFYASPSTSWREVIGDAVIVSPTEYAQFVSWLKHREVKILPEAWVYYLEKANVLRIRDVLKDHQLKGWEEVSPDPYSRAIIRQVVEMLRTLGYDVREDDIVLAHNPGSNIAGQLIGEKIYVSTSCVRKGVDETLDTVVHELMHRLSGAPDASREFEQFLITELVHIMRRLLYAQATHDNQKEE